jgi:hypothetical protein
MHIYCNSLSKAKIPYLIYRKSNIYSELVSDENLKNELIQVHICWYRCMPQVFIGCMPPPPPILITVLEFLNKLWGARNRVGIVRTVPPGYTAWPKWFLRIDSWAPEKFKNSGSGMLLVQEPEVSPSVSQRKLGWGGGGKGGGQQAGL